MTVPQPRPPNPPGCERFEVVFQVADGSWQRELLSSCHGTRFEEALPARPFRFEKGLQSFAGWWYFAKTGTHIGFESWLGHLMLMDFDPEVRAVASQPFWLRWRDEEARSRRHAPDFFARWHDGSAVVVGVRPDDRILERNAQAFAVTVEAATTPPRRLVAGPRRRRRAGGTARRAYPSFRGSGCLLAVAVQC